jgi:hypothetical protein
MREHTMEPAWSLHEFPVVFVILRYGSLMLFCQNPAVWSQGSHMSLSTTSTVRPADRSRLRMETFLFLFFSIPIPASSPATDDAASDSVARSISIYPRSRSVISSSEKDIPLSLATSGFARLVFEGAVKPTRILPLSGSCTYDRTSSRTAADRKSPCIVDTPFGG